jgi:hypothetical protein
MLIFAVIVNLKQSSWHAAVKPVWLCSGNGHVVVNFDVKHTMHGVGVHSVDVPGRGVLKTGRFFSGKKLILDAHIRKKTPNTSY